MQTGVILQLHQRTVVATRPSPQRWILNKSIEIEIDSRGSWLSLPSFVNQNKLPHTHASNHEGDLKQNYNCNECTACSSSTTMFGRRLVLNGFESAICTPRHGCVINAFRPARSLRCERTPTRETLHRDTNKYIMSGLDFLPCKSPTFLSFFTLCSPTFLNTQAASHRAKATRKCRNRQ